MFTYWVCVDMLVTHTPDATRDRKCLRIPNVNPDISYHTLFTCEKQNSKKTSNMSSSLKCSLFRMTMGAGRNR